MTPEQLSACTGCTIPRAVQYLQQITTAMSKWGIDTPLRQAAFLGQVGVESAGLGYTQEALGYSAARLVAVWPNHFPTLAEAQPFAFNPEALANKVYAGRMGNLEPGDGYRYRGRGLIQLTGKTEYSEYAAASDADVVSSPDLLLEAGWAADSAAWYWSSRNCNDAADAQDWNKVTQEINGGYNALAQRVALTKAGIMALAV